MHPKVVVVISTWNRVEILKQVIDSIYTQDYPNFAVVVVDNSSNDETEPYLYQMYKNREYCGWDFFYEIMPHSNFSAMETLNEGFKIAIHDHQADYILVMDDDCVLQEVDTITRMVADIQSGESIGAVACNVVGPVEPLPLCEFKFPMTEYINIRQLQSTLFRTYDFIGCCTLFDAKVFYDIGLYDESFGIYWNEADTALKMLYAGYDVVYDANISPIHYISQVQRMHKRGWFYYVRNGNIIINRFMSLRNRLILIPIRSVILLIRGLHYYKDPILIGKTTIHCCLSFLNIFYMKDRAVCKSLSMYHECNEAYTAFHFRKFYEWLTGYPVIKV